MCLPEPFPYRACGSPRWLVAKSLVRGMRRDIGRVLRALAGGSLGFFSRRKANTSMDLGVCFPQFRLSPGGVEGAGIGQAANDRPKRVGEVRSKPLSQYCVCFFGIVPDLMWSVAPGASEGVPHKKILFGSFWHTL